tara:strand:- start:2954 stop:3763 length:810 start_codon:yes stop_codon:yes gene_type:complete
MLRMELGKITWCSGCPNFSILNSVRKVVEELKIKEKVSIATGIGCHGKIFDYLDLSGIYCLHGRTLPTMLGMKFGNPNLKVIGFSGDGDCYAEGMAHFIHNCRYNADMTLIVHNNQTFSLTTGQPTPVSEENYKDKTMVKGSFGNTINPIRLALSSGCSFVARVYALDSEMMNEVLKEAINHKGFSFVEILQPCIVLHDTREMINKNLYKLNHDRKDIGKAMAKASEWDYNKEGKIGVGVFYQEKKKCLEEKWDLLSSFMKEGKSWHDK